MARSGCCWWLALVVVVVVGVVDGKRPELVGSSVWFTNSTLLNVNFDVAVVQMVSFVVVFVLFFLVFLCWCGLFVVKVSFVVIFCCR